MRRLKKLFKIIPVIVLIIGSCLIGLNVRGYDYQIDGFSYSPYKYIVRVDDLVLDVDNEISAIDCTFFASLNGNSVTYYINPYQDRIDYDESDYLATYNELIDSTTFLVGEYYFVDDNNELILHHCCLFNVYYNYLLYSSYNNAYALGVSVNSEEGISKARDEGYAQGIKDRNKAVDDAIRQTNLNNQDTINYLNSEIERLNGLINDSNPNWASFKNLLSTIFMFPINFFKEGFGVEIWGVNIGYFIIGLFMIFITLTIIAFAKRGSTK